MIGKVFLAEIFFAGTQDMGLQLSSFELSPGKPPSWTFGPPNTEILEGQQLLFMFIMGFLLALDCLGASGSPPCGCVVVPS